MRQPKLFALALVAIGVLSAVPLMAETSPLAPKNDVAVEAALYSVPKLTEGTLVKDLGMALSGKPGIVSAGVDKEKVQFKVTFEPGKTNPNEILKALSTVAKETKLEGVSKATAGAAKHDCGKCPMVKSCAKKK